MINRTVDEDVFDAILKNAFRDAFTSELAGYEAASGEFAATHPTEKQIKLARRAYSAHEHKSGSGITLLRRIAAAILAAFSLGSGMMLASPSVRAAVADTIITFYDKYMDFDFSKKSTSIMVGEYSIRYLPDGYDLSEAYDGAMNKYIFYNSEGKCLSLNIALSNTTKLSIDNEHHTTYDVEIDGYSAYAVEPDDPEWDKYLVWGDESTMFWLCGSESVDTLLRIARSMIKNDISE